MSDQDEAAIRQDEPLDLPTQECAERTNPSPAKTRIRLELPAAAAAAIEAGYRAKDPHLLAILSEFGITAIETPAKSTTEHVSDSSEWWKE